MRNTPTQSFAPAPGPEWAPRRRDAEVELQLKEAAAPNRTGMPDRFKARIESSSGKSLDAVHVHSNSPQPAQLNALAPAQGSEIHVAPGEERHLPHEAWHVVQRAQGRVRPTTEVGGGDTMGAHAPVGPVGTTPLSASRGPCSDQPAVVQAKVLVDGVWYGEADEAALQQLGRPLPSWSRMHLAADSLYVLSADGKSWVADTPVHFMRFKGTGNWRGKTGLTSPDPIAEVGLDKNRDQDRLGPKNIANRVVERVRLFKYSTEREGHWMLQCQVINPQKQGGDEKPMKIDLMRDGYRIMYGAAQPATLQSQQIDFDLAAQTPVRAVYEAFVKIGKQKGPWTGTDDYNCQDFALAMLAELGVQARQQAELAQAQKWRADNK